jgi:hypothetical protein
MEVSGNMYDQPGIDELLSTLHPPSELPVDQDAALTRFRGAIEIQPPIRSRAPLIWGMIAAALVAGFLVLSAHTTGLAQQILRILRLNRVRVVHLDLNRLGNVVMSLQARVIQQAGEPQAVADPETATRLAGFKPRLARTMTLNSQPQLYVVGEQSYEEVFDAAKLTSVLQESGNSEIPLPSWIDGARVLVHVPKGVIATYGQCEGPASAGPNCINLAQVPAPSIIASPGVNMPELTKFCLRLLGASQSEATHVVDAAGGVPAALLALPSDAKSLEEIDLDGETGSLIRYRAPSDPARYTLVWQRNGMLYSLSGYGDDSFLRLIAHSID